ncbi:MAG: DUF469 family protein [Planctomycetales bacterium]|nr:DUF469 family protein [Planctomycetales bacterium]
MKKRLRKKLRLGEYREIGFEVVFAASESVCDEFLEMIERHNLQCGGGGENTWKCYITSNTFSTTEHQREAVEEWLMNHPQINHVSVGPLFEYDCDAG